MSEAGRDGRAWVKIDIKTVQQGAFTSVSPLYPDLLKSDTRTPEPSFAATGEFLVESGPIPRSRYHDRAFAQSEIAHVWKKTWQVVGREEEIPEVGDRFSYDCGPLSFFIVRSAANEFKAFYNSCLHRGMRLCSGHSGGSRIRCPVHGWTWNNDGSVQEIKSNWDFPQVLPDKFRLPEVKCATWGGNIFINPDPHAGPLEDALGVLVDHFKDYDFENRWTAVHVRKKIRGNWKLAMDSFLEGWHLSETHGQAQSFNGDSNSQYDIWEDDNAQISRSITPSAVPSPELGEDASVRAAVIDMCKAVTPPGMPLPDFESIERLDRAFAADYRRQVLAVMTGNDVSRHSDTWMLEAAQYFMFPNFFPWLGEGAPLWYMFMPFGDDPRECVMDIRFLLPLPANGQRPPAAAMIELDFDETFRERAVGFGLFDEVFDQDVGNISSMQRGNESGSPNTLYNQLGTYQECRLKAMHARIARLIGA